jgi:hypothetical protein
MRHSRHYTLEEATDELPWVVRQLVDMREARESLTDEDVREALSAGIPGNGGGGPGKHLGEAFNRLQAAIAALQDREIVFVTSTADWSTSPRSARSARCICAGSRARTKSAFGTTSMPASRAARSSRYSRAGV